MEVLIVSKKLITTSQNCRTLHLTLAFLSGFLPRAFVWPGQKLQLLLFDFSNQKQLFIPPKSCKKP